MTTIVLLVVASLLVGASVSLLFPPAGFLLAGLLVAAVGLFTDDSR